MRTSSPRAKIGLGDPIFSPDPALHSRDHLQLDQCPPYDRAFARLLPESPDGFGGASGYMEQNTAAQTSGRRRPGSFG